MPPKRKSRLPIFAVAALLQVVACDASTPTHVSEVDREVEDSRLQTVAGLMLSEPTVRALHNRLIRDVALALADDGLREAIYRAMQDSPFRENKLHLRTFMESGQTELLKSVSRIRGASENEVLKTLDSLIDLEFYMPVPEHRARWNGGKELLVAGVLRDDGTVPVAYDLEGRAVPIASAEVPPSTPALVLVPVETNFSRPPSNASLAAAQGGTTPGLYLTLAHIYDDHEGWSAGTPEFEIHVFTQASGNEFVDLDCVGESRSGERYWDYDNPPDTWRGEVLVLPLEGPLQTDTLPVMVWENDYSSCDPPYGMPPHGGGPTFAEFVATIIYTSVVVMVAEKSIPIAGLFVWVTDGLDIWLGFASAFNNDDLVGVVDGPSGGCWEPTGPMDFRVMHEDSQTGEVRLDWRVDIDREPLCRPPPDPPEPLPPGSVNISGPSSVTPDDMCTYFGSASGGTPPYTYYWYKNPGVHYLGSGSEILVSTGTSNFDLILEAYDSHSRPGADTTSVTVTPGADPCFQ